MSNVFSTFHSRIDHVARGRLLTPIGLAGIALVAAACGSTTASPVSVPQPAVVSTAAPAGSELSTASGPLGTILVDAQGRTVYEFASDSKNNSTCTGQCLTYWPPVAAAATGLGASTGITGTVGSFTRSDGGSQVTINGLPLYTYAGDTAPGMTTGQGSNGSGAKWWVVAPDGSPITASAAGQASAAPSAAPASAAPSAAPASAAPSAAPAAPAAGGY